ncbi:hypothetical protein HHK36_001121 [Tetracentron sinense]|uniref:Uncharacterized protein n=1 Tax=Tetracentron sinense TaxID=13715 RepID=A0A834ZWQ8_TETSI|nr:hypothetical protein HHK36_001121 [Tetracentron sinense]
MVSTEPSSHENSIPTSANTHHPISTPPSPTDTPLIALNISAQINEKLTPSTFPQWRAQFEALLIGYNLLDYVTGDNPCPPPSAPSTTNPQKTHWIRQDKLILSAILATTTTTITPFISAAKTTQQAWQKLHTMYASKSRTRAMQLKEELTMIKKGNQTVQEYLHTVKALADEISLIDHPISDDDLTLYILNGLGSDFREIAAPIRARERPLAFEELHDLLVGHDAYLCRLETTTQQLVASANYSNRRPASSSSGQNSKAHFKMGLAEMVALNGKTLTRALIVKDTKWLIDSGASHNITGDLANLSIHSEYDSTDEVVIGDGSVGVCGRGRGDENRGFAPGSIIYFGKHFLASDMLKRSFKSIDGVWLKDLGGAKTRSGQRFRGLAKGRKENKHDYPWPDDVDPNIRSGHLTYLSHFKPLTEKPKPVTLSFEKPLVDLGKKIIEASVFPLTFPTKNLPVKKTGAEKDGYRLHNQMRKFRSIGGIQEGIMVGPERKGNMKPSETDTSPKTSGIEIKNLKKKILEAKGPSDPITGKKIEKLKQDDLKITNAFISKSIR